MAEHGFSLIGDDYRVILDSKLKNLEVHDKVRGYIRPGISSGGEATVIYFTPTVEQPVLGVELTGTRVAFLGLVKSNGRYVGASFIAEYGVAVDVLAFVPAHGRSGANYGMQIFDDAGEIVYDSGKQYLENDGVLVEGNVVPAGKTYFIPGAFGGHTYYQYHEYATKYYRSWTNDRLVRICQSSGPPGSPPDCYSSLVTEYCYEWDIKIAEVNEWSISGVRNLNGRLDISKFVYRKTSTIVYSDQFGPGCSVNYNGGPFSSPNVLNNELADAEEVQNESFIDEYGAQEALALISIQD